MTCHFVMTNGRPSFPSACSSLSLSLLSRFTGTPGEPSSPSSRTRAGRLAYSVDLHADLIRVHAHSTRPSPLKRGGRGRRRRKRRRRSLSFPFPFLSARIIIGGSWEESEEPLDTVNRNCHEGGKENPRFFLHFFPFPSLPETLSCVH